jgi:hypothetical protein
MTDTAVTDLVMLDCESFDSTVSSLTNLFQCPAERLLSFLSQPSIGLQYNANCEEDSLPEFPEYLHQLVANEFGPARKLDRVCWFHASRVMPGTTFENGILPLNTALPPLKETLIQAVDDENIRQQLHAVLMDDAIQNSQYQLKTKDSAHWGPFGILVRETAFQPRQVGQHDYLGMPEIIEDICNGFETSTGVALLEIYKAKLVPAFVKFSSTENSPGYPIAAAIGYVHSIIHERAPTRTALAYFNAKGQSVPYRDILKVEYLPTHTRLR